MFNPIYWHIKCALRDPRIRFIFIEGGSSASKTYSVAQALTIDAGEYGYGVLTFRKQHVHIKDTVYETFKAVIKRLKLDKSLYKIQQDLMKGAKCHIRFRGLDDEENIKGIESYNVIYNNEWNQFTLSDFNQQKLRLRGRPNQKIICDWNPVSANLWIYSEVIDKDEWIDQPLIADFVIDGEKYPASVLDYEHSFVRKNKKGNAIWIKTTYRDNYWIVGHPNGVDGFEDEHTIANFEDDRIHRPNLYRVYANGERGIVRLPGGFLPQFNEVTHVKPVSYTPGYPIHATLDENVNPYVTILIWQLVGKELRQIGELICRTPNNNAVKGARELIKWCIRHDYSDTIFVYGDPSGNRRSTVDVENLSFFRKFMATLESMNYRVRDFVSRSAPIVAISGDFLNDLYEFGIDGHTIVIGDNCKVSIDDYCSVMADKNGKMVKPKKKDPETNIEYEVNGHCTDAKRYFVVKLFEREFNIYRLKRRRAGSAAA